VQRGAARSGHGGNRLSSVNVRGDMRILYRSAVAAFALLLAAGCTSAAGSGQPTTKRVTDRDKGTTVTLHIGDRLKVVLASTYWTIHPASKPAVLRSDGRPVTTPRPTGCVPGGGCGTVTATFTAAGDGTTIVSASRTSCGEALRCTGGNGVYRVSVVVK
jgi:hypothetical protein